MQAQHAVMQQSLHYAEEAAAAANSECATLATAVQAMTEQDARARCGLAHRAHHLRDALLQTSAALRHFNDRDRKERNEVGWALTGCIRRGIVVQQRTSSRADSGCQQHLSIEDQLHSTLDASGAASRCAMS
jgi:hypothetical protein